MEGRCIVEESKLRALLLLEKKSKKRGKQRKVSNEDKEEVEQELKKLKVPVDVDLAARLAGPVAFAKENVEVEARVEE